MIQVDPKLYGLGCWSLHLEKTPVEIEEVEDENLIFKYVTEQIKKI